MSDDEPVPVGVKLGSTRTVIAYPDDDERRTVRTLTCLCTHEDALKTAGSRCFCGFPAVSSR
jgi:hypothetical protein